MHEGPQLDQFVGYTGTYGARTPDMTLIGTVERKEREILDARWTVHQEGLATLIGGPAGIGSKIRHTMPLKMFIQEELSFLDVLSYRIRFAGPGTSGFEITRTAGYHAQFQAKIHDPRINRLLVLACVIEFAANASVNPNQLRSLFAFRRPKPAGEA